MVVLVTDGRSQDDVKYVSSNLRQRGATVSENMRQTNIFVKSGVLVMPRLIAFYH